MEIAAAIACLFALDPNSEEYMQAVATLITRLTPGKMNVALANAFMRTVNLSAFEGVWMRPTSGGLQVFLKQRSTAEAHGGQWHCPGTIMRASEATIEQVMCRLAQSDFGGRFKHYHQTGYFFPVADERGTIISHVFFVEPADQNYHSSDGKWYPVGSLPKNMVPHHRKIVECAVYWFDKYSMSVLTA